MACRVPKALMITFFSYKNLSFCFIGRIWYNFFPLAGKRLVFLKYNTGWARKGEKIFTRNAVYYLDKKKTEYFLTGVGIVCHGQC
jgi:hypothetical protein